METAAKTTRNWNLRTSKNIFEFKINLYRQHRVSFILDRPAEENNIEANKEYKSANSDKQYSYQSDFAN